MNFGGISITKPLVAELKDTGPLVPVSKKPIKPLVREDAPQLVATNRDRGVLYEQNSPFTSASTYSAGKSAEAVDASTTFSPLSAPERPALSPEQRQASSVYGRVASFTV